MGLGRDSRDKKLQTEGVVGKLVPLGHLSALEKVVIRHKSAEAHNNIELLCLSMTVTVKRQETTQDL